MATIIGISGSLRSGSYNTALLRAALELTPENLAVEIASIGDIPLYNGDVERAGLPAPVSALKDRIAASAGVLLVTPEYNASIPGVFKNAIDWLSRPPADIARVFGDKPVGLIGASPGRLGTALSQTAWLPVMRALGMRPYFGQLLYVAGAGKLFDESGRLTDEDTRKRLRAYLDGFAEFILG
jgi:chromate reductase